MTNWVFLRGLTREARHWGDFVEIFAAALPDADVIAVDLPGNGMRHTERSPLRVSEMVEACRSDLVSRGLAPPYYLLAMSLGAMVALSWAATYPDELKGCVLINTSVRPLGRVYQRLRPDNYAALLRLVLADSLPVVWERTVLALTSNRTVEKMHLLPDWIEYHRTAPVSRINALRQLIAALAFRLPANVPTLPMLVLASRADRLVAVACSRRLAQHLNACYAEHLRAGHDLPLDNGFWVAQQVAAWQSTIQSRASGDSMG